MNTADDYKQAIKTLAPKFRIPWIPNDTMRRACELHFRIRSDQESLRRLLRGEIEGKDAEMVAKSEEKEIDALFGKKNA